MTKSICMYCDLHLSGSPSDKEVSHGLCPICHDALHKSVEGTRVPFVFFDLTNPLNKGICDISEVNAKLIEYQEEELGRTEREVIWQD